MLNVLTKRPDIMTKRLLALAVLVSLISSCGDDTPTQPPVDSFTRAKAGSSYRYDYYTTDSLGAMRADSRDTIVSTVLRTDGAIGGKTGVVVVEERGRERRDTSYFVYETNNNLSMLAGFDPAGAPQWMTIPVGTGTTWITASSDSADDAGVMYVVRDSTVVSSSGNESLTIAGASVATKKIQIRARMIVLAEGATVMDVQGIFTLNFAPSLGFFVRMTSPGNPEPGGTWNPGTYQSLISYELK